jgi:hypothetical protein
VGYTSTTNQHETRANGAKNSTEPKRQTGYRHAAMPFAALGAAVATTPRFQEKLGGEVEDRDEGDAKCDASPELQAVGAVTRLIQYREHDDQALPSRSQRAAYWSKRGDPNQL